MERLLGLILIGIAALIAWPFVPLVKWALGVTVFLTVVGIGYLLFGDGY